MVLQACIRMGLPAEVVVQVTNKKAELARRHMLKMIKVRAAARRVTPSSPPSLTSHWVREGEL